MPIIFVVVPLVTQLVSKPLDKFMRATAKAEIHPLLELHNRHPTFGHAQPTVQTAPSSLRKTGGRSHRRLLGFVSQPFGLFLGGFLVSRTSLNPVVDKPERNEPARAVFSTMSTIKPRAGPWVLWATLSRAGLYSRAMWRSHSAQHICIQYPA
ncbi:hypothetical protein B0T25DRAFT_80045 [Lasiosphaeria hispida]|uniref:Uncharacterized protein n=1 Tax=Lasiosphaeria hispida TaxID=260671 RepID=A0AAJ0HPF6_9PEZI|nr:hypothetical protein B0T25DRAFT_80045 [Lasiosphaeria hispida]